MLSVRLNVLKSLNNRMGMVIANITNSMTESMAKTCFLLLMLCCVQVVYAQQSNAQTLAQMQSQSEKQTLAVGQELAQELAKEVLQEPVQVNTPSLADSASVSASTPDTAALGSNISNLKNELTNDLETGIKADLRTEQNSKTASVPQRPAPEVGRHVASNNLELSSMLLSLLVVLALILLAASLLKKFKIGGQLHSDLKVITSLHIGAKERLVVVEVAGKQLLLGVTANNISILQELAEPLATPQTLPVDITASLSKLLKTNSLKNG